MRNIGEKPTQLNPMNAIHPTNCAQHVSFRKCRHGTCVDFHAFTFINVQQQSLSVTVSHGQSTRVQLPQPSPTLTFPFTEKLSHQTNNKHFPPSTTILKLPQHYNTSSLSSHHHAYHHTISITGHFNHHRTLVTQTNGQIPWLQTCHVTCIT